MINFIRKDEQEFVVWDLNVLLRPAHFILCRIVMSINFASNTIISFKIYRLNPFYMDFTGRLQ